MALDSELAAWLTLSLTHGLGDEALRRLLVAFGGPRQVLAAPRSAVLQVVPEQVARAIARDVPRTDLDVVERWLEDRNNHVITLGDPEYPRSLLDTPDPPPLLYVKGETILLNHRALAIVGSRNATQQGVGHAEAFAHALSDAGLTIVSGLALGIDTAAHRGGLAGASSSVAIVGTGLDVVYPARNRELAHALAATGAIVSEFALGTPPAAANFPRRNRLISGMSGGCLVVEAALSSGSLITARLANEQGKDVFAIPGSIHSPLAKGCHKLIKQGAKLVECAEDVLEELHLPTVPGVRAPTTIPGEASADHPLLAHLGFDPCDIDTLVVRSGKTPENVAASLTELEIDGRIEALPGGRYQRVR